MAPNLTRKQWVLSLLFAAATLTLSLWQASELVSPKLTFTMLNVGQGEALLIKTPEHKTILIDAGLDIKTTDQLSKNLNFFTKHIDLFIVSHPDRDHYMGILDVMKKYPLKKVMLTGISNPDPVYLDFIKKAKAAGSEIIFPSSDQDLQIGKETFLDIQYPPPGHSLIAQKVKDKNNTSIIARLIHKGEPLIMLTGDAEIPQEIELLLSGQDVKAGILKVGHHGAKTSSMQAFVNAVGASKAIISAGADNKYGHPHIEVTEKLKKVPTHNTATHGQRTLEF